MLRQEAHDRIKGLRSNYEMAVLSTKKFIDIVKMSGDKPRFREINVEQLSIICEELRALYFARMFASFESSLRNYWEERLKKKKTRPQIKKKNKRTKPPQTQALISSLAAKFGVPEETRDFVQRIREIRNSIVHEEFKIKERLAIDDECERIAEACGHLNTYLARLPREW